MDYILQAKLFKVLADANRLKIIDLLSCGELCACDLLEHFTFTQPTLSHHMKLLEQANLILITKKGKWCYYRLNDSAFSKIQTDMNQLVSTSTHCVCHTETCQEEQHCD